MSNPGNNRIGTRWRREAGDFYVAIPMNRKVRLERLFARTAQDITVDLPRISKIGHVQTSVGIEGLSMADRDYCSRCSLHAKPCPSRLVLSRIENVYAGRCLSHRDRLYLTGNSDWLIALPN